MKKILIILAIFFMLLSPRVEAQEDCCPDLQACEQLLDESGNMISDCETEVIELQAKIKKIENSNNNDGDISLADLLEYIPGFKKLPTKHRALIITIVLSGVAIGLSYVPPPEP